MVLGIISFLAQSHDPQHGADGSFPGRQDGTRDQYFYLVPRRDPVNHWRKLAQHRYHPDWQIKHLSPCLAVRLNALILPHVLAYPCVKSSLVLQRHFCRRDDTLPEIREGGMNEQAGIAVGQQWQTELEAMIEQIRPHLGRVEIQARIQRYLFGLLGRAERKNGWQLAEVTYEDGPQG